MAVALYGRGLMVDVNQVGVVWPAFRWVPNQVINQLNALDIF